MKKANDFLKQHPILKLVIIYTAFILLATVLLKLPFFLNPGYSVSWLDAFFMSNSSVTTTGLVVVDYVATYNYAGWILMIMLFNIGGIGIILFNTIFVILIGKKLNIGTTYLTKLDYNQSGALNMKKIIKNVVKYFMILEMAGAIILFIRMADLFDVTLERFMNAWFLSASAISGSGFYNSTIINGDYIMMWTVSLLMIFSFIGYPVIIDLKSYLAAKRKHKKHKFSSFTKVSVKVNLITTIVFALIFFFLEYNNSMVGYNLVDKMNASMYISLSTKSVGLNLFNDINTWLPATLFLQTIFMLIGGAPSSACGGIKTNAIYVFWRYLVAQFKDGKEVVIYGRKLPEKTINRSITLILLFILISVFSSILILIMNPQLEIFSIFYDVVSGFTTTGFSTGALAMFNPMAIFIVAILMGVGRIGVLNILFMLNKKNKQKNVNYVEEDIAI